MNNQVFSIFFDGTGNGPRDPNPSNVFKLYQLFTVCDGDPLPYSFYSPGPGASEYDVFAGNAAGSGIWNNLKDAYRELTRWVHGCPGLELAVFGFSRGAYSAHLFLWLLARCGIPSKARDCDAVVDCFVNNPATPAIAKYPCTPFPSVEFVGVWDIVKSVIPNKSYYDGTLPEIVKRACHAMALDELRTAFPVLKWQENGVTKLQQIWFAGVHSDVGGGYAKKGLSEIALQWIYENARQAGLPCAAKGDEFFQKDPLQDLNNPYIDNPAWGLLGWKARIYEGENRHASVILRHQKRPDYTPKAENWIW